MSISRAMCLSVLLAAVIVVPAAGADSGQWAPISDAGAPSARFYHTAVWTGSHMIVWGGADDGYTPLSDGGEYDAARDAWTPVPPFLSGRYHHTAVWTGTEMIVWGGLTASGPADSGAAYDPVTRAWRPTSAVGAPLPRFGHTAVWTGERMIVWGGALATGSTNTGGIYDPATDRWSPLELATASLYPVGAYSPPPRSEHLAVWTGNEMVTWGGHSLDLPQSLSPFDTGLGSSYVPAGRRWSAVSGLGAPVGDCNAAVWTGTGMIVWGSGHDGSSSGGIYDPRRDLWAPVSKEREPSVRRYHSAVWTGSAMIVWGGDGPDGYLDTGSIYDPAVKNWVATSTIGAPQRRSVHTAVWTGERMIVWGGESGFPVEAIGSGGAFTPS